MQSVNSLSANQAAAATDKPNIIFILGDDIGYEIPTCNGGQSYKTKNLDNWAKKGARFTQVYGAPDCCPSRFMLFTGKYNFRNYTTWGVMDLSQRTIANMLKDGGYATCFAGKWQLDGADNSIRTFGFDKYSVWLENEIEPEESLSSRYKNSIILQDGAYLPAEETQDKYSVDIFTNYVLNFMDSNKNNPFFIFYAMPLSHKKFTPTPDDADYAGYDFNVSNKKYFPNMVKYMDKQLGIISDKIKSLSLSRKTIYIFLGDNGTPKNIASSFNGYTIPGEKGETTTYGTHVPLIFYAPQNVPEGVVSDQLVDFTDFMPTLATLTGTPLPADYGILDGKDFSQVVKGTSPSSSRDFIFTHFQPFLNDNGFRKSRYVSNANYKLYDETGLFYNIVNDVQELSPVAADSLTETEQQTKAYFQQILSEMNN